MLCASLRSQDCSLRLTRNQEPNFHSVIMPMRRTPLRNVFAFAISTVHTAQAHVQEPLILGILAPGLKELSKDTPQLTFRDLTGQRRKCGELLH